MAKLSYNRTDHILKVLKVVNRIPSVPWITETFYGVKPSENKVNCAGINMDYPVGLAAGIDRTGEFCNIAASYGVSFVEIGPVYDIPETIEILRKNKPRIPVLADLSGRDDEKSFSLLYDFVSAVVLNIPNLVFEAAPVDRILQLRQYNDEYRPVLFRVNADISKEKLDVVMDYALSSGIDGILAPVTMLEKVVEMAMGHMDIICYGIFEKASDVKDALDKGAAAVAVSNKPGAYGPSFIKNIIKNL